MDLATALGSAGLVALVAIAIVTGQVSSVFLNFHGLFVVLGGCAVAMLLNTPLTLLTETLKALMTLWRAPIEAKEVIPTLITMSQNVHARGLNAMGGADQKMAAGFLQRAAQVSMEFKEPKYVEEVLSAEIAREMEHHTEIVNVFRTMSILFPMFGLIGTLIGIVDVLKQISDPAAVGPAMAVAITSAFYGISLANLFATPIAGKLRLKFLEEYQVKAVIVEGVTEMLKGTVPVLVERRLESYLLEKR